MADLAGQVGRLLVYHLDVSVQGVFVDRVVLAQSTLKSPLLEVHCGNVPLQGEFVSGGVFTDGALVPHLAGLLVPVRHVSLQCRLVNCVVVTHFAGKYQLGVLLVQFSYVSLQRRPVASLVVTTITLVKLHFIVDGLNMAVQGVLVKTLVVAPEDGNVKVESYFICCFTYLWQQSLICFILEDSCC